MKFIRFVFVFLMLAGASSVDGQAPSGALSPGDQIRIVVFRKPEYSGDFAIAGNGTVAHPLFRDVQVTGVPFATVEERIRTLLTRYETNPQFVIQALVKVIVGGEVRTPNIYMVPPETTVAQALALAGGPTTAGNFRDVRIIRDQQEIRIDVSKPESDAQVLQIRSNDQILVGRRKTPLREYIGPVSSTIAAVAAIASIIISAGK